MDARKLGNLIMEYNSWCTRATRFLENTKLNGGGQVERFEGISIDSQAYRDGMFTVYVEPTLIGFGAWLRQKDGTTAEAKQ